MPTYEYYCARCEASYDLQEGFSAPNRHRCKECKRGMAKRVLHAPRIVFKGSGFYATDSKGKSAAVTESDGDAEPKTETKTKTKPAATKKDSGTAEPTTSAAS